MLFVRCSSDFTESEIEDIKKYGEEMALSFEKEPESVFIHFEERGDTTNMIESTSNVQLKYIGFYLDGVIFDNTFSDTSTTIKVSSLLTGLQIALPYFGKGGSGYILIPSAQGFGSKPPFGIRKNEIIAYYVEILDY